jgi:trigger factor
MEEQARENDIEQQQWHHVVNIEELEGLKRKVMVTYDTTAVKMAFDKAGQEIGKRVMINGFRRGKAPRALVERFCAKEIEATASSMLSQEGYLHAVYEHKLAALTEPKVENPKFNTDGTFSCDILVEVKPAISPTGYIGLKLTRPDIDPAQTMAGLMSELRSRFAKFEEREVVAPGMTVVLDYSVSVGGQEVLAHQGVPFQVGEAGQVPLAGIQVVGLGIGSEAEASMTLPADFKDHGGEEAKVRVVLRRVLESVPPTDEELAARNGLASVEELVRNLQQHANMDVGRRVRQVLEEQAVDLLLGTHEFQVPADWAERETQYLLKQLGIGGDMDEKTGDAVRQLAERNVRRSFMLDAIYDAEPTLKVKAEEVEIVLDQEAAKQGTPKTQLKRMLLKQGMMDGVVELVKGKKIMDFLISNAEISTGGPQAPQGGDAPRASVGGQDGGQRADPDPAGAGLQGG